MSIDLQTSSDRKSPDRGTQADRAHPHEEATQSDRRVDSRIRLTNPVLVDRTNVIIAGHGRVEARPRDAIPRVFVGQTARAEGDKTASSLLTPT
jgi:hypothetical protein